MTTTGRVIPILAMAHAGLLALSAAPARAADVGVRAGVYSFEDGPEEPFLGAELLFHAGDGIFFNPNAEYVFVDGARYWTFNFDAHWDLPVRGPYLWLGGGLAIVYVDPDGPPGSTTEAHANLLAGIGFRTGGVVPYIQVKLITGDPTTFVAAAGLRF